MQALWKAGTVYVSEPGEGSAIGADSLNEMRLGAGVRLLGVARFRGAVIRSPALTLQCSDGSRGTRDAGLAFSERILFRSRLHAFSMINDGFELGGDQGAKTLGPPSFGSGRCPDLPEEIAQIAFHQRDFIPDIGEHR